MHEPLFLVGIYIVKKIAAEVGQITKYKIFDI